MRRILLGLTLLFVAPRGVESQPQSPTPRDSVPPVPVSSAAPADSLKKNTLYYVSGGELIPCASHVHTLFSNSALELQGETGALTIVEAQPHFRMLESSDVPMLRLGMLEINDGKRRARMDPRNLFKKHVPLLARKVQDRIFDLAPTKPLVPGEYAIGWHLRFTKEKVVMTVVMIKADFTVAATPTAPPLPMSPRTKP